MKDKTPKFKILYLGTSSLSNEPEIKHRRGKSLLKKAINSLNLPVEHSGSSNDAV